VRGFGIPARWRGNVRAPSGLSWQGGTAARGVAAARERGDERLVSGTFTTAVQVHTTRLKRAALAGILSSAVAWAGAPCR
jgi:xanthine dehydrogenase YagR molybdenum-binding subunit